MYLIMQRGEFSLSWQDPLAGEADFRHAYKKLLLKTFDKASYVLKVNSKNVSEIQFASHALSVFFFRVPLCSTMVVDALQMKLKEQRDGKVYSALSFLCAHQPR